ncbi:hypothetical protein F511_26444 [Dorcoceras hygrometricum]|uniref:Uncharacterized protein n=1 Tax=Dorcoceras hygrometricum TaxID=472368 RepID=A0A2Z7CBJ0_9LAMI|nr:hypothetical protein F511_26444 [Dorcoceras hygrometricum]
MQIQQQRKLSSNANSAQATSSSPRPRFPYAKQDSLYRKLHRGNSKRFVTRTRQTSRCNGRFRGFMIDLLTQINAYVNDFVTVDSEKQHFFATKCCGNSSRFLAKVLCKRRTSSTCVTLNGSGIQLAVGPQPLRLRNYNSGLAQRIMVKRLPTSPHDPLGITDSACKNQSVVVSVQYGPFNPYIPIRSTTIDISDFLSSIALDRTALRSVQRSFAASVVPSVQFSLDQRPSSPTTADISSSLRFDTTDVDATVSSLPHVSQDVSAALADLQVILSEQINESQSGISSKMHKIEQSFRDSLSDQAALFKSLSQEAPQNASIFVGLADVRKEVQEVNAKVDIMASRLNVIQKDAEATKEALSHQLLEFQSQAQENQNIIHAQLSELVDYIHRGSADKNGESGSRGLQQPANVQVSSSAERTPTFAQRVEMAQRHIVHTVLDADANRALLERQAAAERDRERRRREARMLKRRRRD